MDFSKLRKLGKDEMGELFIDFRRGDGADTGYILTPDNCEVWVNEATVVEFIIMNGATALAGFRPSDTYTPNIHDIVPKPSDMVQLLFEGVDPLHPHKKISDISEVYIFDREMETLKPDELTLGLCTHTISMGKGCLAISERGKVDYEVQDDDGKVWAKIHQTGTTIQGVFGGEFPNNHPRKADIPALTDDSRVSLPLKDPSDPNKLRNYNVKMRNTGELAIEFWVLFPWSPDGNERRIYLGVVNPKETSNFYINASELGLATMPDYMREIKLNFNTVSINEQRTS